MGETPLDMILNGGIPAKDKEGNQCYLYVGIVDLLQEFDLAHKWQYGWKAVKHGCSQLPYVSVQPPKKYKGTDLQSNYSKTTIIKCGSHRFLKQIF